VKASADADPAVADLAVFVFSGQDEESSQHRWMAVNQQATSCLLMVAIAAHGVRCLV
jgi:hypothetical protein